MAHCSTRITNIRSKKKKKKSNYSVSLGNAQREGPSDFPKKKEKHQFYHPMA